MFTRLMVGTHNLQNCVLGATRQLRQRHERLQVHGAMRVASIVVVSRALVALIFLLQ